MNKFSHVSFLSDYGTQDEFVGVVKAVIADIAPHVNVIDLVHDVTPFDVPLSIRAWVDHGVQSQSL